MYAMGNAPASSKGMPSGMKKVSASFATACSARPPQASVAMTRSPGLKRVARAPQRETTPAVSSPGLNGKVGRVWYWPATMIESA
jgi:hypothetical protein